MTYCATVMYHKGTVERFYDNDQDKLEMQVKAEKGVWAWRIVNRLSGKCVAYYKEGEREGERCYNITTSSSGEAASASHSARA